MPQLIDLGRIRLQFLGDYSGATTYRVNDVVRYGGNLYVYINATNTAANAPTNGTYWSLMLEGINYRGDWLVGTVYLIGDVVGYGGIVYIAVANSTGVIPSSDPAKWAKFLDGLQFEGTWSSATQYQKSDIVRLGGRLYLAISDVITKRPDDSGSTEWVVFSDGSRSMGAYDNAVAYFTNDLVTVGSRTYKADRHTTAGQAPYNTYSSPTNPWSIQTYGLKFRSTWAASTAYEIDDVVTRGSKVYVSLSHHTSSGAFVTDVSTKWTALTSGARWTGNWYTGTVYLIGDLVKDGVSVYVAEIDHTSGTFATDLAANKWSVFAQGADYLPAQLGNNNRLLSTNGTTPSWVDAINIDGIIEIGLGANEFNTAADLTDPMAVFNIDGGAQSYAQLAIHNAEVTSSTDLIVYSDNGTDTAGWIDVGVTGSKFIQSGFGLTKQNEGYLFYEAPVAGAVKTITNKQLTANVVTLTTSTAHGFAVGNSVVVSGVQTTLNGTFTVTTVPTSTTFTYAKTLGNIASAVASGTVKIQSTGNLTIATGAQGSENKIIIGAGGFGSGTTQMSITPNASVNIAIATASTTPTTGALTVDGGVGVQGNLNVLGNMSVQGDINLTGLQFLAIGDGASTFASTLTNPQMVVQSNDTDYSQIAFRNIGNSADSSTDLILYANNGTDAAGWIDMGITSAAFNDPLFTLTGNHDGYIFMEAPVGTTGDGNLVIATGGNGLLNKIIFGAGGLTDGNQQMIITPDVSVAISIPTQSISSTTGALTVNGGVGILGNLNVAGNSTIAGNMNISGEITVAGAGTTFATANLAVSDPMVYVASPNPSNVVDFAFVGEAAVSISPIVKTVTFRALTSNEATVTTSTAHTFQVGDYVVIAGAHALVNGTQYITAVPTSTTFTFDKTNANVASTATSGTATVSARAKYSGLAKDATDGKWKLFKDASTKPTQTVDFGEAGLALDTLVTAQIESTNVVVGSSLTVNGFNAVTSATYPSKGNIVVGTGSSAIQALTVGANDTFVQADSTAATGLKYTNLATGTVLGAVKVTTAAGKPATPAIGQLAYETDTFNVSRYTANGWRALGPTFLGFTVDNSGNLVATTGADTATYNASSFLDYTILPSEMSVSVSNGNLLLTS